MNISSDVIKKLCETQICQQQKKEQREDYANVKSYYEDNRFLLFSLSLLSKKAPVLSALMEEIDISPEEGVEYVNVLRELDLLSMSDENLLSKINSSKKVKEDDSEILEKIIEDFNKVTNKKITLTAKRKAMIRKILATKEYTYKGFPLFLLEWPKHLLPHDKNTP